MEMSPKRDEVSASPPPGELRHSSPHAAPSVHHRKPPALSWSVHHRAGEVVSAQLCLIKLGGRKRQESLSLLHEGAAAFERNPAVGRTTPVRGRSPPTMCSMPRSPASVRRQRHRPGCSAPRETLPVTEATLDYPGAVYSTSVNHTLRARLLASPVRRPAPPCRTLRGCRSSSTWPPCSARIQPRPAVRRSELPLQ